MGFGNKNVPSSRMSMAGKGTSSDGWGKPGKSSARVAAEQEGEGGALALYAMGGLIAFGVTAGYLFFDDLPVHTYGPKKIFVNQMGGTNYHKLKKEFAKIIPSEEVVAKDDTQYKLAQTCLNGQLRTTKELSNIPFMYVHSEVKKAREYLVCAMQNHVERLCTQKERQHLITQLSAFFQMREAAFGVEGMFKMLMNGSAAGRANMMMLKGMNHERKEDPNFYKVGTKLPRALNAELANEIRELSAKGYLTRWDFHWTGLSMPELIAPLLAPPSGAPACAEET